MSDRTVKVTLDQLKDWEGKLIDAFLEMTKDANSPEDATDAMLNVAEVRQALEREIWQEVLEPFTD